MGTRKEILSVILGFNAEKRGLKYDHVSVAPNPFLAYIFVMNWVWFQKPNIMPTATAALIWRQTLLYHLYSSIACYR